MNVGGLMAQGLDVLLGGVLSIYPAITREQGDFISSVLMCPCSLQSASMPIVAIFLCLNHTIPSHACGPDSRPTVDHSPPPTMYFVGMKLLSSMKLLRLGGLLSPLLAFHCFRTHETSKFNVKQ